MQGARELGRRGDFSPFPPCCFLVTNAGQILPVNAHFLFVGAIGIAGAGYDPAIEANIFKCLEECRIIAHWAFAQFDGVVFIVIVVVQVDIGNAVFEVVYGLDGIITPMYGVGHVETELAGRESGHKAFPFVGAVYHVIDVGMKRDGDAEWCGEVSKVFIDFGHLVKVFVGGVAILAAWAFGHKERDFEFCCIFNAAFVDLLNRVFCAEGDVGAAHGGNLDIGICAEFFDATGRAEPI